MCGTTQVHCDSAEAHGGGCFHRRSRFCATKTRCEARRELYSEVEPVGVFVLFYRTNHSPHPWFPRVSDVAQRMRDACKTLRGGWV